MRISDWSSDLCSSDFPTLLRNGKGTCRSFCFVTPPVRAKRSAQDCNGLLTDSLALIRSYCSAAMKPHYRKIPAANSRESAQSTAMALFGVSTTPPVTRLVVGSRFGWVIPKHLRNFYLIVSRRLSSARTRKPVLQRDRKSTRLNLSH